MNPKASSMVAHRPVGGQSPVIQQHHIYNKITNVVGGCWMGDERVFFLFVNDFKSIRILQNKKETVYNFGINR